MTSTTTTAHDHASAPTPGKAPSRATSGKEFVWSLTDHCCRACFSRVLVRETFDRRRVYRCAGCGVEKEGRSEAAICACGIRFKTGTDAGVRCAPNKDKSPEWPAEISCSQAAAPASQSAL